MSKILTALASVQARVKVPKARSAAGRYAYRNLDDICEKLKEPLRESGAVIILSDEPVAVGGRFYIKATATMKAEDGEISAVGYAMEEAAANGRSPAQLTGAASTYARKYALAGLLLLDDARDPDEEEARCEATPQGGGVLEASAAPARGAAKQAEKGPGVGAAAEAAKALSALSGGELLAREAGGPIRVRLPGGQWRELGALGAPFVRALIARPEYAPWRAELEGAIGGRA